MAQGGSGVVSETNSETDTMPPSVNSTHGQNTPRGDGLGSSQHRRTESQETAPETQQDRFNKAYEQGIRDYQKAHAGNTAKAVLESFLNSEQSKNSAMARDRKRKNTKDDSERKSQPQMRTVFDVLNF